MAVVFVMVMGLSVLTAEQTVTGMLVEAGCGTNLGDNSPSEDHVACMVRCGKQGEPLGIVTEQGLYTITGEWAKNNTPTLLELMAQQVAATGEVREDGIQRTLELTAISLAQ